MSLCGCDHCTCWCEDCKESEEYIKNDDKVVRVRDSLGEWKIDG